MLWMPREEGQGLTEYAMLLMLIAIVLIAIVMLLGNHVVELYSQVVSDLPTP